MSTPHLGSRRGRAPESAHPRIPTQRSTQTQRTAVFDVPLDDVDLPTLVDEFDDGVLVFHNLDTLLKVRRRPEFNAVCRRADMNVVDGQVLAGLLRLLWGRPMLKASGSDFLPAFCDRHADSADVTMFLLGAGPGIAGQAADRLNRRVGRKLVVGSHSPSFTLLDDPAESAAVVRMINDSGADTLAVGLGAPKQERWIDQHRSELVNVRRFMAVGATLDFEAGSVSRAPRWMSVAGLEWLFRLVQEPRRLWRRYLWEGPQVALALVRERFSTDSTRGRRP